MEEIWSDKCDHVTKGRLGGEEMEDVEAIHRAYLTPAHKRKGKGGRQPAADPRLDPSVDPKRARRILANRLSAARSKMKQKSHVEVWPASPFQVIRS
jgi:hypothetical protein